MISRVAFKYLVKLDREGLIRTIQQDKRLVLVRQINFQIQRSIHLLAAPFPPDVSSLVSRCVSESTSPALPRRTGASASELWEAFFFFFDKKNRRSCRRSSLLCRSGEDAFFLAVLLLLKLFRCGTENQIMQRSSLSLWYLLLRRSGRLSRFLLKDKTMTVSCCMLQVSLKYITGFTSAIMPSSVTETMAVTVLPFRLTLLALSHLQYSSEWRAESTAAHPCPRDMQWCT